MARIIILTEGYTEPVRAKTACSVIRYRGDEVVALLDKTQAGRTSGELLGVGDVPILAELSDVADADTYSGGETITVTISGGTFRGFFVQARRRYDDAMLGTFDIVDEANQQNRCDLVGSRCIFSSHDTVT